jgi:general secretion pathway protein M
MTPATTPRNFAKVRALIGPAAVAVYLALLVIAVVVIWTSLSAIAERRASVAAAERALREMEGRAIAHKETGSPLGAAPAGTPFLAGQTLNVAGAALLQRVATAVQRVGGSVLSSQVDLDSARAKEGWVGLVVSLEVSQSSLQPLLYDVEAGMPFLFIDQLDVQAPRVGVNGGRMRVRMDVSGQWWQGK